MFLFGPKGSVKFNKYSIENPENPSESSADAPLASAADYDMGGAMFAMIAYLKCVIRLAGLYGIV